MASAITLEGIDQAIINLKYKNQNTLKYRFVHHIRQYYTTENAVATLNEIGHEELIKIMWDVDHGIENIKSKRKNLNSVRSSVNADLKKLFEKGENPEGIKIGSSNIFIMSEDAKDDILKKLGYDLQPDGTLKLDQIMDILKLANETVSGSMAVENNEKKEGLKKIDQLKDLIKGLSEKVGLGPLESSQSDQESDDIVRRKDGDGTGLAETAGVSNEEPLDEVGEMSDFEDEIAAIDDFEDVEVVEEEDIVDDAGNAGIDGIVDTVQEDLADIEEIDEDLEDVVDETDEELEDVKDIEEVEYEDILDDVDDAEIDGIVDTEPDDMVGKDEIEEDLEDSVEKTDAEMEDIEDVEEVAETFDDDISADISDALGAGGEDTEEGVGFVQKSEQDIGGDDELFEGVEEGLEAVSKEDGKDSGEGKEGEGYEQESGLSKRDAVIDEATFGETNVELKSAEAIEEVGEEEILDDIENVEIDEIIDVEPNDPVGTDEIEEDFEDGVENAESELEGIEDIEEDEDVDEIEEIIDDDILNDISTELGPGVGETDGGIGFAQESEQGIDGDKTLPENYRSDLEAAGVEDGKRVDHDKPEDASHRFEAGEEQRDGGQLGLPVDSLGQEYHFENDSNIKNSKLLAEEFDGYLGSMDRYYNQYILIPGGEYLIGSGHPKKDDKSEQKVYLEPFYIGRFPITNGLFEIFVEKTGYKTTAEKVGYGTVYYGRFEKKKDETTGLITSTCNASLYCKIIEGACWYQPSGPKSTLYNKRNHPVVQISMEDAVAFAAWTGKRLPTENEWEAASRTTDGWILPWGQEWKIDACNVEDSHTADTTPVDKYVEFENNYGIVDTIGNVLEWTNNNSDSASSEKHGTKLKAAKGGSWISGNDIRLFSRFMIEPELHSNILGFRCVAY